MANPILNIVDEGIKRANQFGTWLKKHNRRSTNEKINKSIDNHDDKSINNIVQSIEKNAKQESTPKIKWQEDRGCWCVPDDEMKLLLQEATLQK